MQSLTSFIIEKLNNMMRSINRLGNLIRSSLAPAENNTSDIGTTEFKYKDGHFAGTINANSVQANTIGVPSSGNMIRNITISADDSFI